MARQQRCNVGLGDNPALRSVARKNTSECLINQFIVNPHTLKTECLNAKDLQYPESSKRGI
ncbi:hypothetical protein EPIR_1118 [Erwinia piriflorinigrans CFBP 5888]|uniref:Uncharacterized protein n=1 Tax=Erwinia piriflorinigrans CFBP 5888 TaxID=1161919 RepID=V5Z5F4_9GAMM|nr:hypothetical protein EPIR_1118 [Erwinia piriflorinigrans CFBP 5888]